MKLLRLQRVEDERLLAIARVPREKVVCTIDKGHTRGGRRVGELTATMGSQLALRDFVFTWTAECLIRATAASALSTCGLTGFEARPAQVSMRNEELAPGEYREFFITGYGGCNIASKNMRVTSYCPACDSVKFRLWGDPGWSFAQLPYEPPADFFRLSPFGHTFVSARAAYTIEQLGVEGMTFVDADSSLAHTVAIQSVSMAAPPTWLSHEQLEAVWVQIKSFDRDSLIPAAHTPRWLRDE
jgi:hypothetical protein